jgi:invasion protein IalB
MEQRVVMSNTGQLLAGVTIRMPADSQTPVLMIRTPFGLNLPAGLKLAIDDRPVATLPLQTCDGGGCYAGEVVSAELLEALKRGTTLSVTFQDTTQRDIAVPVSLNGFTAAYDKIHQ